MALLHGRLGRAAQTPCRRDRAELLARPTRGAWVFDMTGPSGPPATIPAIKAYLADSSISFSWDDGLGTNWVVGNQGPITSICANMFGCPSPSSAFFNRTWGKKF